MPISDLPFPLQEHLASLSEPRWEPVGRYHVTESLYCLVKAQLRHYLLEAGMKSDSPFDYELYKESLGAMSWAPIRGQIFHKDFEEVMAGGYRMDMSWNYRRDGDHIKGFDTLTITGMNDWTEMRDWPDPEKETMHIGELKTVANRWWYLKHGPDPKHLTQVAVYLTMLRSLLNAPLLRDASFYYLDMKGIDWFPHHYKEEELTAALKEVKETTQRLHDAYKNKEVIDERREWKTSWECNPAYCSFTDWCHGKSSGGAYPMDPPPGRENLKEWYAGKGKVKREDIETRLISPEVVDVALEYLGVELPGWRRPDED